MVVSASSSFTLLLHLLLLDIIIQITAIIIIIEDCLETNFIIGRLLVREYLRHLIPIETIINRQHEISCLIFVHLVTIRTQIFII